MLRSTTMGSPSASGGSGERPPLWPLWSLTAIGIAQRLAVLFAHRSAFEAFVRATAQWYPCQNLYPEILRDRLGLALLYLQQTPPLSNLAVGVALKWLAWPVGVAYGLVSLQGLMSIASALVLLRILQRLYPGHDLAAFAFATAFLVNTDLVVMDYAVFKLIYENAAMLLAIATVLFLVQLARTGALASAGLAGLMVALLALTRATWCYFFPLAALLVVLTARRARVRNCVGFLLVVALLHGGWVVKNYLVFGSLSVATSSWGGILLFQGLQDPEAIRRFVASDEAGGLFPQWFVTQVRDRGFDWRLDESLLPESIRERDREMRIVLVPADIPPEFRAVGFRPPVQVTDNWAATAEFSRQMQRSFLLYLRRHPNELRHVATKAMKNYRTFWQPIRNYGQMFVHLFAVDTVIDDGLDVPTVLRLIVSGALPERQLVAGGRWPAERRAQTTFYTIHWLDAPMLVLNVLSVHVLAPALLMAWAWRRCRAELGAASRLRAIALVTAMAEYGYLAAAANAGGGYAENMRFRLEVEAVIWLVTAISVGELVGLAGRTIAAASDAWRQEPGPRS